MKANLGTFASLKKKSRLRLKNPVSALTNNVLLVIRIFIFKISNEYPVRELITRTEHFWSKNIDKQMLSGFKKF